MQTSVSPTFDPADVRKISRAVILRNIEVATTTFEPRVGIIEGTNMEYTNSETPTMLGHRISAMRDLAQTLMTELEGVAVAPSLNLNDGIHIRDEVTRYEIDLIRAALRMTQNHQRRAAEMLGIKATTLNSKIKKYKLL